MKKEFKKAFTLAEVLITLAIIGIIAAITIPSVIKNYRRHEVIVKLKRIYSTMNNALNLSRAENGNPASWDWSLVGTSYENNRIFFDKYIGKYLSISKIERYSNTGYGFFVYLKDGSILRFDWKFEQILYYIKNKNINVDTGGGDNMFVFTLVNKKSFEPFYASWNGSELDIRRGSFGCYSTNNGSNKRYYCAYLIMKLNNWNFPDDYPWL